MKEIKKINPHDILDYGIKYFPNFRTGSNPFEFIYAYYLDGKMIGFIDYSIIYEKAEINYIAVSEEYRRKGIGEELLNYFISKLNGVSSVSLEVNVNNEGAIKFYLKNGFVKKAIRKNYYNGEDAYLMVKKLEVI
ncbi:MAG: GNAT family N-acetyltransferase [Bacilli bacterium]|nr:GNAT family N-acetyltransferase [Bacilli bacterium]